MTPQISGWPLDCARDQSSSIGVAFFSFTGAGAGAAGAGASTAFSPPSSFWSVVPSTFSGSAIGAVEVLSCYKVSFDTNSMKAIAVMASYRSGYGLGSRFLGRGVRDHT